MGKFGTAAHTTRPPNLSPSNIFLDGADMVQGDSNDCPGSGFLSVRTICRQSGKGIRLNYVRTEEETDNRDFYPPMFWCWSPTCHCNAPHTARGNGRTRKPSLFPWSRVAS